MDRAAPNSLDSNDRALGTVGQYESKGVGRAAVGSGVASPASASGQSAETAALNAKMPDELKGSHVRRDNFLSSLIKNRVSDRTNVLARAQNMQPMVVRINELRAGAARQLAGEASGGMAADGAVNANSALAGGGRIQLNDSDLKMIKSSLEEELRHKLNTSKFERASRDRRTNTLSSHDGAGHTLGGIPDLTQYAQAAAGAELGDGFPDAKSSLHVSRTGAMGLKIDIGIKNPLKNSDREVDQVGAPQLKASSKTYRKGPHVDLRQSASPRNYEAPQPLIKEVPLTGDYASGIAQTSRKPESLRRPLAH